MNRNGNIPANFDYKIERGQMSSEISVNLMARNVRHREDPELLRGKLLTEV